MTIAAISGGAALGLRAAFGVLLVPLAEAVDGGREQVAGAIALNALLWALTAAPLGLALDRWGPRKLWAAAAVAVSLGLLLAATVQTPWALYLGLGGLAGVGLTPLMVNTGQAAVVAQWFVRRRGLAMGVTASGAGLGVLLLVPLTQWIVVQLGWQAAMVALAALFGLGVAPLNLLAQRHRPTDCGLRPYGAEQGADLVVYRAPVRDGPRPAEALAQRRFWALAVVYLAGAAPGYLVLAHGIACLLDAGFQPEQAAVALGLCGLGIASAMVLWGYLADRWSAEIAYSIGSLALLLSLAALATAGAGREWLLGAFVVLFALGFGARQGLHGYMGAALAQGPALGTFMGLFGAQIGLGAALGPALGGWLFAQTGGYTWALAAAAACTVLATGCVWLAAPRRGPLGHTSAYALRLALSPRQGLSVAAPVLVVAVILVALLELTRLPDARTPRLDPTASQATGARLYEAQLPPQAPETDLPAGLDGRPIILTLDVADPWLPQVVGIRRLGWRPVPVGAVPFSDDDTRALRGRGQFDLFSADGTSPSRVADYDPTLAILGHYAYVTAGSAGLRILDFTASSPIRERYYSTPGAVEAVLVRDTRAYVAVVPDAGAHESQLRSAPLTAVRCTSQCGDQ